LTQFTVVTSIEVAFLAMLLYPQVMCKAQDEIDAAVGPDRLPNFDDCDSLPYVQALIKETVRWRPIAPTGFPHATMEDDTYKGMFIPKGSTVYANIFSIMSDAAVFEEPDVFHPDRFLEGSRNKLDSFSMAFGFGRRKCPGEKLALNSMFIMISRILWAFDVVPALDPNTGGEMGISQEFVGGLIRRPANLKYRFSARRSEKEMRLIYGEAERAEAEASAWK